MKRMSFAGLVNFTFFTASDESGFHEFYVQIPLQWKNQLNTSALCLSSLNLVRRGFKEDDPVIAFEGFHDLMGYLMENREWDQVVLAHAAQFDSTGLQLFFPHGWLGAG